MQSMSLRSADFINGIKSEAFNVYFYPANSPTNNTPRQHLQGLKTNTRHYQIDLNAIGGLW